MPFAENGRVVSALPQELRPRYELGREPQFRFPRKLNKIGDTRSKAVLAGQ